MAAADEPGRAQVVVATPGDWGGAMRPLQVREMALGLIRQGLSGQQAACRVGVPATTVRHWATVAGMDLQKGKLGGLAELRKRRQMPPRPRAEAPAAPFLDGNGRLDLAGRVLIQIRLRERCSYRRIAVELGVAASTVSREISAHALDGKYRASDAHRSAVRARHRTGNPKLVVGSRLWQAVVDGLDDKRSPEQITGRLRRDFGDQHDMQVSLETIYQALYVQAAGGLRHELSVEQALRQGRTTRRPQSKLGPRSNRSWIGEATISNRPPEAADRAIPGHWEGDLVIGTEGRSALITLVERSSRFLLISRLDVHDTATVTSRLTQMAESLPDRFATITWDQGVEMAGHTQFTIATGCPVYFADPHSPWQRPTNENSNGLIRDYYPKGTDFTTVPDTDIIAMQDQLNRRPRKVLDYATPAETLHSQLVLR
jgi:IS30 family transposase